VSLLLNCPISNTLPIPSVHVTLLKLNVGKTVVSESPWACRRDVIYSKNMMKKMELMGKKCDFIVYLML